MNEKEKRIKDQRTIEATTKGLMGISGKLGLIVRTIGQPIINQTENGFDEFIGYSSNPFYSYDHNEEPESIRTIEVLDAFGMPINEPNSPEWNQNRPKRVRESMTTIGWIFDSLNNGTNLEIKYMLENSLLTVQFNGIYVFKECEGDLLTYVPESEWELKINSLFKKAKEINDKKRNLDKEKKIENAKIEKENWLEKLRKNWGF